MISTPPKQSLLAQPQASGNACDAWPEVDQLAAEADVRLPGGRGWYASFKVALDYTVALALTPFAIVLVGFAAIAVKLTSRGPVFYTQTRVGLNGRLFRIIKIRTMRHNCELKTGIQWAKKNDTRVTLVGKFLRLTHIDELPQLWNVLCGEMSLVGPRPERPEVIHAKQLERLVPGYGHRLDVKPGVTGLAQVQLPADTDITSVKRKVAYDLYYVQHQGLLLDLRLLVATAFKPLIGAKWLRRLFLLPSRKKVTVAFQNQVTLPPGTDEATNLQPA
jgi:lipopolysaccharide/colanic/teichoic acid biosynthesis glycosyltransferase